MHPLKLELDEAQDFPEAGWVELGETLKYGDDNAIWRAHGVSRGVRDRYYKQTQPESGWFVHRLTAMHRPDWTAKEREAKAELYGSRDHPDYRRNILGEHGDATSSLFVLSRLMKCVDQNKDSKYNSDVYTHIRINDEQLTEMGIPIREMLNFPKSHEKYERTWAGMDIGLTNHPSEILIWGEEGKTIRGGAMEDVPDVKLCLLTRVHLERISAPNQIRVMEAIFEFYKPKGFGIDRTGLGLPIYQDIMEGTNRAFARAVKGYNFSEKRVVGYEKPEDENDIDPDNPYGTPITANVLEYSSDMLRKLVDQNRLVLPWDLELIREFQGQTYQVAKSNTDPYGRKIFSQGTFHALDAARMAALAYILEHIEQMEDLDSSEVVFDSFLMM